jgi:ribonucleoside-diphosphate reductase alpha chain
VVPHLVDRWGEAFDAAYRQAEADGLAVKTVKARELYARMMRTLAQTGNGWMTFKDRCNATSNQTAKPENVIHLSNLCTEILEVSSATETAVCNLGSVNLARHVRDGAFDFDQLASTVRTAVRQLNRVIDLNYYPIATARNANMKWRPVGLGVMGLQDVFFKLRLPFDSAEALALSTRIAEEIYFHALSQSCELAQAEGAHPGFDESRAAHGELQFDHWPSATPHDNARWDALRERIKQHGLRNSLLIAIAPTATIASIAGCYECIEPQVSNLFKRETLSGDFLQVNRHLADELKALGLWTSEIRDAIKLADGSIQNIAAIPERLRAIYRTVWELPQKSLIDLAAARGAYIDQSQSLNLFMENPNIGQLSSMYMYAWKAGIKTTYYLRSRPATKIAKTTVSAAPDQAQATAAVFCSLENPEYCEACQ